VRRGIRIRLSRRVRRLRRRSRALELLFWSAVGGGGGRVCGGIRRRAESLDRECAVGDIRGLCGFWIDGWALANVSFVVYRWDNRGLNRGFGWLGLDMDAMQGAKMWSIFLGAFARIARIFSFFLFWLLVGGWGVGCGGDGVLWIGEGEGEGEGGFILWLEDR
jgi:hypothetical protein